MLFLRSFNFKPAAALMFAFTGLVAVLGFLPPAQSSGDLGIQAELWTGATVTTTTQAQTVACGQGAGMIGRKTLAVHNGGSGAVTVTVELRDRADGPNVTASYLAVNNLSSGSATSATVAPTAAGGRFCRVSAVSASSSVFTASLRRE